MAGFRYVLEHLRHGGPCVAAYRTSWDGGKFGIEINTVGHVVRLQVPDQNSKMTLPYLYIEYWVHSVQGTHPPFIERVPWQPLQADIMADDWEWKT